MDHAAGNERHEMRRLCSEVMCRLSAAAFNASDEPSPFDSMREATLTVSPNRQYLGIACPTTPAYATRTCIKGKGTGKCGPALGGTEADAISVPADSATEIVKFTISIPRESCTNAKAKYSSSVVPPDPSVHFYDWVKVKIAHTRYRA